MSYIVLFLAILFSVSARTAHAGFDFDRRVSATTFDCGDIFEEPCGIAFPDNATISGDSVAVVWGGDYNPEYGVLYADLSPDGGRAWGTDVTMIDQQRSIGPRAIASSPNDPETVVIAWVTYAGLGMSLFLDISYDGMRTFAYPRMDLRAARDVANATAADIAMSSSDTLVAVFARNDTLWAKVSTVDNLGVWGDSAALYSSANDMDQVDAQAGEDGEFGVVWREKIGGRGVIRALTFDAALAGALTVEPIVIDSVVRRRRPTQVAEVPAVNTMVVSDDPSLDYTNPNLRSLPSEFGNPGAWWVAFHDTRGRILLDRRVAMPSGSWGGDILLEAPSVDMPTLAVAQEGGVECVIVAYRQWGEMTLCDVGEFDGASMIWMDRESVSSGRLADRVHNSAVVVLDRNPLQYGVAYTPINHNGVGAVWFRGFTYSP